MGVARIDMSIESATEKPDAQPRKSNSWSGVLTKLPVGAGVGKSACSVGRAHSTTTTSRSRRDNANQASKVAARGRYARRARPSWSTIFLRVVRAKLGPGGQLIRDDAYGRQRRLEYPGPPALVFLARMRPKHFSRAIITHFSMRFKGVKRSGVKPAAAVFGRRGERKLNPVCVMVRWGEPRWERHLPAGVSSVEFSGATPAGSQRRRSRGGLPEFHPWGGVLPWRALLKTL